MNYANGKPLDPLHVVMSPGEMSRPTVRQNVRDVQSPHAGAITPQAAVVADRELFRTRPSWNRSSRPVQIGLRRTAVPRRQALAQRIVGEHACEVVSQRAHVADGGEKPRDPVKPASTVPPPAVATMVVPRYRTSSAI